MFQDSNQPLISLSLIILFSLLGISCRTVSPVVGPYSEEEKADRMQRAESFGDYYVGRMKTFLADNPSRETGGILFLGDSITERFPVEKAFPHQNVINRGIGGDSIRGVMDRLDTSVVDLDPRKIYLLIGVNDLMWSSRALDEHRQNYDELLTKLEQAAPDAEIVVQSLLPVTGKWSEHNAKISAMSEIVEELAVTHGMEYLDLRPRFLEDGELRDEYSLDGVHLTPAGNLAWLEVLVSGDQDYQETVKELAPIWLEAYPQSYSVDIINPDAEGNQYPGARGPDMLVVYTDDYGKKSTGTNEWGIEAIVKNGEVVSLGTNDTEIAPGTFVVSGHGKAAAWINANLSEGQQVALQDGALLLNHPKTGNLWIEYWHAVAHLMEEGGSEREWKLALKVLEDLRAMDQGEDTAEAVRTKLAQVNPDRYM